MDSSHFICLASLGFRLKAHDDNQPMVSRHSWDRSGLKTEVLEAADANCALRHTVPYVPIWLLLRSPQLILLENLHTGESQLEIVHKSNIEQAGLWRFRENISDSWLFCVRE